MNTTIVNLEEAMQFAQAFYDFEHDTQNPEYVPSSALQVPLEEWLATYESKYTGYAKLREKYYLAIPKTQLLVANKLAKKFGHGWAFDQDFLDTYQGPISELAITVITNLTDFSGMGLESPYVIEEESHSISHTTGTGRVRWEIDKEGYITVHINRPIPNWEFERHYESNPGQQVIAAHWNGETWKITPLIVDKIEMRHIMALKEVIQVISGSEDAGSLLKETFNNYDSFFTIDKVIQFLNESEICRKVTLEMKKRNDNDKSSFLDSYFQPTKGYTIIEAKYSYILERQFVEVVTNGYGVVIQYPLDRATIFSSSQRMSSLTTISLEDQEKIQEKNEREKSIFDRPDRRDRSERIAQVNN